MPKKAQTKKTKPKNKSATKKQTASEKKAKKTARVVKKKTQKAPNKRASVSVKKKNASKKKSTTPKRSRKTVKKTSPKKEPLSFKLKKSELEDLLKSNTCRESKNRSATSSSNKLDLSLEKVTLEQLSDGAKYSPFVLDLTELKAKKEMEIKRKQKLRKFWQSKNSIQKPIGNKKHTFTISAWREKTEKKHHSAGEKQAKNIPEKNEQFTHKPWFYDFNLPFNWHKSLAVYLLICLSVVLPIKTFGYVNELRQTKAKIEAYAYAAYEDLKIAGNSLTQNNTEMAETNFQNAGLRFHEAGRKIEELNGGVKTLVNILPHNKANLEDADHLLKAGQEIAIIGKNLTQIIELLANDHEYLTDAISAVENKIGLVATHLNNAGAELKQVRAKSLPEKYQSLFYTVVKQTEIIGNDLQDLHQLTKVMNYILGQEQKKRYLFVFQNSNELRATGGFMGSFALVDIDQGQITDMEIPGGGTSDLQGSLIAKRIAPEPLHLVNPLWEMQDANWWPDFPASAKKIKWFYEKSGGPTVDGVIAINSDLLPAIMNITGPIEMTAYGKTLTTENVISEIQKSVEFEYDKQENKPKQILTDLAPILLDKIFNSQGEDLIKIMKLLRDGLNTKEIQMYFRNEKAQNTISDFNWSGEIKNTSKDYLMVVNTNIRGEKTDAYMKQDINLVSHIQNNGEIINTLTITRTHQGGNDIFSQTSNIDYLRIYTPIGSQLISASGFSEIPAEAFEFPDKNWQTDETLEKTEKNIYIDPPTDTRISHQFNKTVFANWLQVDPGESKTVVIKYKLPFHLNLSREDGIFGKKDDHNFHSLFMQKQSGQIPSSYQVHYILPENMFGGIVYPSPAGETDNINFSTALNRDQLLGIIIK